MDQVEAAGVGSDSDSEDEEVDDEGTAVIGHVEVVTIPPLRRASTIPDLFLRSQGSPPQIDFLPTLAPLSPMQTFSLGTIQTLPTDVSPTPSTVATSPRDNPSETASLGSIHSMKSTRSLRSSIKSKHQATSSDITRTSLVYAAKTRSQRASKSSLRLPTKPRTSHYPPVPGLPLEFTFSPPPPQPPHSRRPLTSPSLTRNGWRASSFSASRSAYLGPSLSSRLARMSHVDVRIPSSSKAAGPLSSTMDDIYLRPHSEHRLEGDERLASHPPPVGKSISFLFYFRNGYNLGVISSSILKNTCHVACI